MAPAPAPKGIKSGIKSLPKWSYVAIPLAGAGIFYLYQKRKSSTANSTSPVSSTADTTATPADTTGSSGGYDVGGGGSSVVGGGGSSVVGGQDVISALTSLQGQESTELTDLDTLKTQSTQALATEAKDLSVDNKSLATDTKDLAIDTKDLAADNSGLSIPVRVGGSTSAPKKVETPAPKLETKMASPKVAPAKTAPAKKTLSTDLRVASKGGGRTPIPFAAARPKATVSGGKPAAKKKK